jgi:long-chain fatty acid transport protein
MRPLFAAALLALALPAMTEAAAFEAFGQGAKAAGMAGAFVAQADDPTSIHYNIAGLVFVDAFKASVGVAAQVQSEVLYQGLPPGKGQGTTGEQRDEAVFVPHAYLAMKLGKATKLGIGVSQPFSFRSRWDDPDGYAGRESATAAEVQTWDATVGVSHSIGKTFAVGAGVVYRSSVLELDRRYQGTNPISGLRQDFGALAISTDAGDGAGFTAGLLHKPSKKFSWGASYRSAIEIDYAGSGTLTQISTGNAQLDELLRTTLPFGQDLAVTTKLELPDQARLGFAFGNGKSWLLELDIERIGWATVQQLRFDFPSRPELSRTVPLDFEDTFNYRLGFQYSFPTGFQLRAGVAIEESPQPDETVGPFLADGERTVAGFGVGLDWLQLALQWVEQQERLVATQQEGLNGNYRASSWLFGLTVNM